MNTVWTLSKIHFRRDNGVNLLHHHLQGKKHVRAIMEEAEQNGFALVGSPPGPASSYIYKRRFQHKFLLRAN